MQTKTPTEVWRSGVQAQDNRRCLEAAAIALLAAVMVWGASQSIRPAAGQVMVCGPRAGVLTGLANAYQEAPSGIGLLLLLISFAVAVAVLMWLAGA